MGKNKESALLARKFQKMILSEQISGRVTSLDPSKIREKILYMKPDRNFTTRSKQYPIGNPTKLPEAMAENVHKAQKFMGLKTEKYEERDEEDFYDQGYQSIPKF